MIARPLVILLLQSLFRCAVRRIEEIWNSTCHASEENNGTSGMRQSASNGVPGRGGIFVPGGTGYRVAAGFERTAGSPAGRDGERRDLGSRFLSSAPPHSLPPDLQPTQKPGQREVYEKRPENRPAIDSPSTERKRKHLYRKKYDCFFDIFPLFCRAAIFRPLYRNSAGTAAAGSPKPGPPATCIRAWLRKRRPPRLRTPAPSQCT